MLDSLLNEGYANLWIYGVAVRASKAGKPMLTLMIEATDSAGKKADLRSYLTQSSQWLDQFESVMKTGPLYDNEEWNILPVLNKKCGGKIKTEYPKDPESKYGPRTVVESFVDIENLKYLTKIEKPKLRTIPPETGDLVFAFEDEDIPF